MMAEKRQDSLPDVDAMLSRLADETPPVPEDFHARWTEAVRAEPAPSRPVGSRPGTFRIQMMRLAGAAAIMVFLLGGTLLTRDSSPFPALRLNRVATQAAKETQAVLYEAPEEAEDAEEAVAAPSSDRLEVKAAGAVANAPEAAGAAANAPQATGAPASFLSVAMEEEDAAFDALGEEEPVVMDAGIAEETAESEEAAESEYLSVSPGDESPEEAGTVSPVRQFGMDLLAFLRSSWPILAGAAVLGLFLELRAAKGRRSSP